MCTAGKTAPKLVDDFLRFDPQNIGSGNCLTEHPLPAGEGKLPAPSAASKSSCRHEYLLKTVQSVLPSLDDRPDAGSQYRTALLCKKCMIHADIHILYPYPRATNPCPSAENPLHHFQYRKDRQDVTPHNIRYGWQCSIENCHADITISFRKTRISERDRELLAGKERLQKRFDEALQAKPDRNVKLTTPTAAMNILHRYLKDALDPNVEKRRLKAYNKVFTATFGFHGRDCHALLTSMGFVFHPPQGEEEAQWTLPNPPPVNDRLHADGNSQRELLEDMELEAIVWCARLAFASGEANPAVDARGLSPANSEVERMLGAQNYPTRGSLKRAPLPNDLAPYFASLGALDNFTDALIEFAYDRQTICDPALSAYYFECLQAISEHRVSEGLQIKVATLHSQDLVSRRDLRAAYRFLTVKEEDTDEHIINTFSSRQASSGKTAQEENRQALGRIGLVRQSNRLIKASKQELETYEDALNWLNTDKTIEDSFIVTMLTIKTADNPSDMEMARKAATIIADERGSNTIRDWLTGKTTSPELSVDEALHHLNISTGLDSFDQATLQAIFESARSDRPGAQTEEAIAAIQKAQSNPSATRPPELWPVGLTSHGNTCYLNSLLQYYFSVKPLREIVLNYDKYKLDTNKHSEKTERVGQRIITGVEIRGGQKFADDLKHLFERMIKDRQSHVRPEQDLVCRAFLEPKDYALLTSEVRGENKDVKANGTDTAMDIDSSPNEASCVQDTPQSNASSPTLVGDVEDVAMKDNDAPPPTPPGSPSQKATQTGTGKPEPTEPPPLPPRRFSTTKEQALSKAQTNARLQQDVTEVHDGAMFRLRSGMIPKGMDERGEQQDELRDIFEISLKETTVQEDGSEKAKVEANSSITLDVPNESTDVYVLLDKVFDLQGISDTKKTTYKTIQTAPPLLQIAIPRIGYDAQKGAFKSEELVLLHDELYLDRYMDDYEGQVLPKRRTCWGWRRELRALKAERNSLSQTKIATDGPTALAQTASVLKGLEDISDDLDDLGMDGIDVEPDLAKELEMEAARARARITELQQQIDELQARFNEQFSDLKNVKYELASVFIHRGSNSSGHYWIYIKDFEKGLWRKYNDETVTQLSNSDFRDLMQTSTWANGTPTYAVYVREDDKKAFVQPVCRKLENSALEAAWNQTNGGGNNTVTEGGQHSWDQPRQVGENAAW